MVSYQYLDALDAPGAQTTVVSPVVSYQYFDWIGDENVTFTNSAQVSFYYPATEVATLPADTALGTSAVLRGQVDALAAACVAGFEWGVSPTALTNRTAGQDIGDDAALVSFSATLTGLKPGTTYFFRARKDSFGAAAPRFGETLSFTTTLAPPKTAPKVSVTGRGLANERTLTPAYFTFRRTGDLTQPLAIFFALSGTAIAGVDYDSPGTSATFAAGAASVEIAIKPRADAIPEPVEKVIVTLLASANYQLVPGASVAQRSIMDQAVAGKLITLAAGNAGQARTHFPQQPLSTLDQADQWFRLSVPEATTLNVSVTGHWKKTKDGDFGVSGQTYAWLAAHLGVDLISPSGETLKSAEKPFIVNDGVVYYPAQSLRKEVKEPGIYYLRVYKTGEDGGLALNPAIIFNRWFLVSVSSGPFWDLLDDSVPNGPPLRFVSTLHNPAGEVHHIGLRPRGKSIVSRTPTWIVTHGRTDSWTTFQKIGAALARPAGTLPGNLDAQVLYLDWMSAAAADGIFGGVSLRNGYWFPTIGTKVGAMLSGYDDGGKRFAGSDLRTAGHSWGTYVNYEIAKQLAPVAKLVALDPARNATNYAPETVSFRDVSSYSLGFWSSQFGSADATGTSTDAFEMEVSGSGSTLVRHRAAHLAFHTMLKSNDSISTAIRNVLFNEADPIWLRPRDSQPLDKRLHYRNTTLQNGSPFSFTPDGFEGSMSVQPVNGVWRAWEMFFHAP